MLNSMVYEVKFPDGVVKNYSANMIAENILSQVDSNIMQHRLLDSIIDHKKDGLAVTKQDAFIVTKGGRHKLRQTTIGWKFQDLWKDPWWDSPQDNEGI